MPRLTLPKLWFAVVCSTLLIVLANHREAFQAALFSRDEKVSRPMTVDNIVIIPGPESKVTPSTKRSLTPTPKGTVTPTPKATVTLTFKRTVFPRSKDIATSAGSKPYSRRENGTNKVLIYSMGRSGTSFTGSLFSHHPRAFYISEPFNVFFNGSALKRLDHINRRGRALSKKLYNCQINQFMKEVSAFDPRHRKFQCSYVRYVKRYGYVPQSCKPNVNRTAIESICKRSEHVVMKTILLRNFSVLLPLMREGVKVVHLVRDPRGQVNSLQRLYGQINVEWLCQGLRQDLEGAKRMWYQHSSIKKNYLLLRYEDLVDDPMEMVQVLYDFAGVKMHAVVKEWVRVATTTKDNSAATFSTRRMSNETAEAWRTKMAFEDVLHVQRQCKGIMDDLGYIAVSTTAELHDRKRRVVSKGFKLYLKQIFTEIQQG